MHAGHRPRGQYHLLKSYVSTLLLGLCWSGGSPCGTMKLLKYQACPCIIQSVMFMSTNLCTISFSPSSHRIAHKDKETVAKALLKLKPALLSIAPVAMSTARSAPMVNRELPPMPTTPEKFATGSYVLEEFRISPIPPAIPAKGFSYCSSTCYHNDVC